MPTTAQSTPAMEAQMLPIAAQLAEVSVQTLFTSSMLSRAA